MRPIRLASEGGLMYCESAILALEISPWESMYSNKVSSSFGAKRQGESNVRNKGKQRDMKYLLTVRKGAQFYNSSKAWLWPAHPPKSISDLIGSRLSIQVQNSLIERLLQISDLCTKTHGGLHIRWICPFDHITNERN
jgi:hypothetical protein